MRHEEGKEEEEGTATKKEDPEVDLEETKGENPLEKYMKMVLEAREKQHAKVRFHTLFKTPLLKTPSGKKSVSKLIFFGFCSRALKEKKWDIQAQKTRLCPLKKKTGTFSTLNIFE